MLGTEIRRIDPLLDRLDVIRPHDLETAVLQAHPDQPNPRKEFRNTDG